MPTYSYECDSCGFIFDKQRSILAEPEKSCPKCNGSVSPIITGGSGVIFAKSSSSNCQNADICGQASSCCEGHCGCHGF